MSGALLPFGCVTFFLSGAAALVFEALWFRQAGLVFGNSVWASALVLSSFMAGQALGNALAAGRAGASRRPFTHYAILEATIGAGGLALVFTLPAFTNWLTPLLAAWQDSATTLHALRFAGAFALLVLPAAAMGATLPMLVAALRPHQPDFGRLLGQLYGWNTLGAVLGAVASELVLIPLLGIRSSGLFALALNLSAAGIALGLARRAGSPPDQASTALESGNARPVGAAAVRLLAAAFLSGGALLGLEVVWFRVLSQLLPSSSEVFAWLLAVVLAGIGLGSLLGAALFRRVPDAHRAISVLAGLAGLLVLASFFTLLSFVSTTIAELTGSDPLGGRPRAPLDVLLVMAALLMLGPSLVSGAMFGALGKRLDEEIGASARATGLLALCNTLGAMGGPLIAGFVLLPRLGMTGALLCLTACYAIILALTWQDARQPSPLLRGVVAAAALALALVLGLGLVFYPRGQLEAVQRAMLQLQFGEREKVLAFREGLVENIAYLRHDWMGEPYYYRLVTDGYSMSGTTLSARRYMRLYVHLPAAIHPGLEDALLISFGVGVTASALSDLPELERIDIVDISRDILEMSDIVYGDGGPLRDPRVDVHIEDGRYFLQSQEHRYDLISAEPPPPAYAGVVNLYTREYFELMHTRLREGGMATYWLPVSQMSPTEAKAIVAGFCGAFDDCSLWDASPGNWMLLGTRDARGPVSLERLRAQWRSNPLAGELRSIGLDGPADLGALFLGDAAMLADWTRGVPALVDDFPGRAPKVREIASDPALFAWARDPALRRARFETSPLIQALWPSEARDDAIAAIALQPMLLNALTEVPTPSASLAAVHRLLESGTHDTLALWLLGTDSTRVRSARMAYTRGQNNAAIAYHTGVAALVDGEWAGAAALLARATDAPYANSAAALRLYATCRAGDRDATRNQAAALRARRPAPQTQSFWHVLSELCGEGSAGYQPSQASLTPTPP